MNAATLWPLLMAAALATPLLAFGVMAWRMHRDGERWTA